MIYEFVQFREFSESDLVVANGFRHCTSEYCFPEVKSDMLILHLLLTESVFVQLNAN